jgi:glycine oxidase
LVGATVENAGFVNRTTGQGIAELLQTAFEISPELRKLPLNKHWSGLRPKSLDGLPLLGEFPENSGLYFATGHYRNGILLAPLTGKLIADKICDNAVSPYLQIFNPNRFTE